jgi:protein TonB
MAAITSPLERAETPVRDRLVTTLFLAAVLHGMLILGVTFTAEDSGGESAPGLQVQLVADGTGEETRDGPAAYLAQVTHQGTGTTRERVIARTPLGLQPRPTDPSAGEETPPRDPGDQDPADAGNALLVTSAPRATVRYTAIDAAPARSAAERALLAATANAGGEDAVDRVQMTGPLAREGAWVSPDTRASVVAPYLDAWRRKVERLGTLNYPTIARSHPARRNPVLEVQLNPDGRLRSIRISRSSGVAELDEAALQILRLANPFDPFPADLARAYPVLRFAYEWQFEAGSQVSLQGSP